MDNGMDEKGLILHCIFYFSILYSIPAWFGLARGIASSDG